MIDWTQVRFATCRLCGGLLDRDAPNYSVEQHDLGIREGMVWHYALCRACLLRCALSARRKARVYTVSAENPPYTEYELRSFRQTREEVLQEIAEERAEYITRGSRRVPHHRDSAFIEHFAEAPEYWRDRETPLTDLDIAEYVAAMVRQKPKWADWAILPVAR